MVMRDADTGHNSLVCLSRKPFSQKSQHRTESLNRHLQNPPCCCSSCTSGQSLQIQGTHFCTFPLSLRLPVSASFLVFFFPLQSLTFSSAQQELPGDNFLPICGCARLVRQAEEDVSHYINTCSQ